MNDVLMGQKYSKKDLSWSILLLFGTFCIAFNLAIAFHELGHAFTMILDGVGVRDFHLNPFSWSWTFPKSLNNVIFTASGGVTFGLIFAILPSIAAVWIRNAYFRIPAFTTAAFAFSINGIYLIAGTLFKVGDGGELIQYGVSHVMVLSLGGIYIIAALFLLALIQPLFGINKEFSFGKRFLIFGAGIIPYLSMMFIYNLFLNKREIMLWFSFVVAGVLLILLLSFSGYFRAKMHEGFREVNRIKVGWGPVLMSLILGFAIIIGELIIFGVKESPF